VRSCRQPRWHGLRRVFSPEALRPHLSMGLPLYRPESSYVLQDKLRTASRRGKQRETVEFAGSRALIVPDYCDIRCRTAATECYDCSRRNGTPAARRGRKAADLPARGRLPGYRTGELSSNRHRSLRHCFIHWNPCSDGWLGPHRRGPPHGFLRRYRSQIEGGGGSKRTRFECSAGEWGAALAAPFFIPDAREALRLRDNRNGNPALRGHRSAGRCANSRHPCPDAPHRQLLDARAMPLPVQEVLRPARRRRGPPSPIRGGTRQLVRRQPAQEVARKTPQRLNRQSPSGVSRVAFLPQCERSRPVISARRRLCDR